VLTHALNNMLGGMLLAALTLTAAQVAPTPVADNTSAATGCVSNAEYRRLALGQRLRYIRRVAGDDAQISMRRWTQSGSRYQQRVYTMCTPWDANHDRLTTRFTIYQGAWRAYLVDTRVGPEE
jgi:hypothetical protein